MTDKIKIYGYSKCSTCKKAYDYLKKAKISFEIEDITIKPPTKSEIKKMVKALDGDFKKLFNTSGVQYKELKIKDKIVKMSSDDAIELLAKNGRLIKRPFLLLDQESGMVGFKEEAWDLFFK